MAKALFITLVLIILIHVGTNGQTQTIKGNGYVLTQQRETGYFNSINVSDKISVYIVQGELQPITIEADNNLFDCIKTVVRNHVLKIYIPDTVNIVKFADMNVLISMPSIFSLHAYRGSFIDGSPQIWNADNILVNAGTGSRIKLHTKTKEIQVSAQTSANIELHGSVQQLKADLKTGARLSARDLKTRIAQLTLATGARAEVEVSDRISYDLCGNARLFIHGNPQIIQSNITSGSKVIRSK